MTLYHLRSNRSNGSTVGVQEFSAPSDEQALSIAREMVKTAAEADFELWHGRRCVHMTTLQKEKRPEQMK